jgi:uncharacterized protein
MPASLTYPGVYVEEISSGVRTITGVSTSVTAFVGLALRGPVNEATFINSYGDFERVFGGLWIKSSLSYAVQDFYRNGGSQAIIVRLVHPNYPTEEAKATAITSATAANAAATAVSDAVKAATDVAGAKAAATSKANEFNADGKLPAEKVAAAAVAKAVTDSNETDLAKLKKIAENAAATAQISPPTKKAKLKLGTGNDLLTIEAISEGTWGNNLRARVDIDVPNATNLPQSYKDYGLTSADLFNLTVRDMGTGVTEVFRNVTVKPSPRQIAGVLTNESSLVHYSTSSITAIPGATGEGTPANDEGLKIFPFSVKVLEADKGTDSEVLDSGDFTGTGLEAEKKGLFTLLKADIFNLLCIPPYKDDSSADLPLLNDAAVFCQKHRAFLIIDSPPKSNKTNIKTWVDNLTRSNYAAVFFPRLKKPNPLHGNQLEEFASCGAIAGIFASTDAQRGVWKAPAGLDASLVGVPDLSFPLTDDENGELNPLGINCLRSFPVRGRVVWGSRTLKGADQLADEYKYIPVRRLALYLEESLYRGTQWIVFEPNDEPLWAQIRLNIGAFMNNLFRQGAFQGRTPQDAYFVKCSSETTTQNDINLGIVNIIVGFAPLKPAEFVVLKFQQIAGNIAT